MSKLIETKYEFQTLAEEQLVEAKALLDLGKWDGAYYLAGYAVELALKACIIRTLMVTDAFPDKEFSKNCYTHAIDTLVGLANWQTARDWSEQKRYHRMDKAEAEDLYRAIADDKHGVLQWIKTQW